MYTLLIPIGMYAAHKSKFISDSKFAYFSSEPLVI